MSLAMAAPAVPAPDRGLNRAGSLTDHMVAVLRRGGADMGQLGVPDRRTDRSEDDVWDKIAVPKARARRLAWERSIEDAAHNEYLPFRLLTGPVKLDANQKPKTLQNWLDSLIEAQESGARPETLNMIIAGNIGTGKTAAACALGNEAVLAGLDTLFVKHATYLTWRRPDSAPHNMKAWEVRKKFATCKLLILDELCGEMDMTATEFTRRETTDLIDARISAGRPTAYTTNLRSRRTKEHPGLGVVDILGERLLSRLEASAHLAKITGTDRRKPTKPLDW
ncbi:MULTISPECIES: ATP-binding protein [Streptomyces]|uniref:ATP-binding protein n=1 Tax=Streptomyces galilaeus TaxID=33899 RepID=A0ABW9IXE7_STRGJ